MIVTATAQTTERTEMRPVVVQEQTVTLVMSEDVAVTLRGLVGRVGGLPSDTYRQHTGAIDRALFVAGVRYDDDRFAGSVWSTERGVR